MVSACHNFAGLCLLALVRHKEVMKEQLCTIAHAERDGTRAETRFRLSPKRTSPFKSVWGVSSVDCWQPRCAHQLE